MDQRTQFEPKAGEEEAFQIELFDNNRSLCKAWLAQISSEEIVLRFPQPDAPVLGLAEQTQIKFSGEDFKEPYIAPAIVQKRSEAQSYREYKFWFKSPPEIEIHLAPTVKEIFNRRGALRVTPRPGTSIPVEIKANQKVISMPSVMFDISSTGMAVGITFEQEKELVFANQLLVAFSLPNRPGPLKFEVQIVYRELVGDIIHYGLAFVSDCTEQFEKQLAAIRNYIGDRQKEIYK